jgi:hypothetical protein
MTALLTALRLVHNARTGRRCPDCHLTLWSATAPGHALLMADHRAKAHP